MRSRSLFTRLLMAQGLLAVVLTAMLAVLFYGERNLTVAQLVASIWSPSLKQLAQDVPIEDVRARAPGPLQMRTTRPERVLEVTSMTPRLAIVPEQLLDIVQTCRDATGHAGQRDSTVAIRLES